MAVPALPTELQERLSSKIKEALFDLLPEEKVNELLAAEIKGFFETEVDFILDTVPGGYNTDPLARLKYRATPLTVMVHGQVHKFFKEKLEAFFAGPEFKSGLDKVWKHDPKTGHGEYVLEGELTELFDQRLQAYTMDMAKNMFANLFAQTIDRAKQDTQLAILDASRNRM
jgi:hypothetical protein